MGYAYRIARKVGTDFRKDDAATRVLPCSGGHEELSWTTGGDDDKDDVI
jgi:hypothetical protein